MLGLRFSALRWHRQTEYDASCTPASPSDTAGFRPSPLLSHLQGFSFSFLSVLPPPARRPLPGLNSSHVGPVRASAQPVWTPAGRRTARWSGLCVWGHDRRDVTSTSGVPPGPPGPGAKLWRTLCLQVTGVFRGACVYGQAPPGPAGPPTASYPTASLRTTHAL